MSCTSIGSSVMSQGDPTDVLKPCEKNHGLIHLS